MLIYNVFGRHIGVQRKDDRWLIFRADLTERKFSRLYDSTIPDDMTEGEIAGWVTFFSMKPQPSAIPLLNASNRDSMDSITLSSHRAQGCCYITRRFMVFLCFW